MKNIIFVFYFSLAGLSLSAQEKYEPFIAELFAVYNSKYPAFYKEVQDAMCNYQGGKIDAKRSDLNYLFWPGLLLKDSKNLYNNIDTTNLVKYFDPYSMYFYQALVSIDSSYVGNVVSRYIYQRFESKRTSKKGNAVYRSCLMESIYKHKPAIDDYIYEELYEKLQELKPDLIFSVQNIAEFFIVKDNQIFVLESEGPGKRGFSVYPVDEYAKIYKEFIFDAFFRYTPRVPEVICY